MLSMKAEIRSAHADLNRLHKQFRFAQAVALTRTAQFAQMDIRSRLSKVFDRPTPFTTNSTYAKRATPAQLVAEVGFRGGDSGDHYLAPQVHGGDRRFGRFEERLRRAGVLGASEYLVPARGYPLDAYGNVPSKVRSVILADLQAHPDHWTRSTKESRAKRSRRKAHSRRAVYFATRPGSHLPLGIYERVSFGGWGSSVRAVFMFVRRPSYRVRLPLREIVVENINLHLAEETDKALSAALATARTVA